VKLEVVIVLILRRGTHIATSSSSNSRMTFGSPTPIASDGRLLIKRTPLPLSQIAVLLLLRFCEAASVFVIFPFLNEVCILHIFTDDIDRPKGIIAPDFSYRWR